MGTQSTCCGKGHTKNVLLYACSGAANVGEVADRTARQLMAEGYGSMFCLAGLGGDVGSMIEAAKRTTGGIVIDGCPQDCGRRVMERVGVTEFRHIRVTDLGIEKVQRVRASGDQVRRTVDRVKSCEQSKLPDPQQNK